MNCKSFFRTFFSALLFAVAVCHAQEITVGKNVTVVQKVSVEVPALLSFSFKPPTGYEFVPKSGYTKAPLSMTYTVLSNTSTLYAVVIYVPEGFTSIFNVVCGGQIRSAGEGGGGNGASLASWKAILTEGKYLIAEPATAAATWLNETREGPLTVKFKALSDDPKSLKWECSTKKGLSFTPADMKGEALTVKVEAGNKDIVGVHTIKVRNTKSGLVAETKLYVVDVDLEILKASETAEVDPGLKLEVGKYYPAAMTVKEHGLGGKVRLEIDSSAPTGDQTGVGFYLKKEGSYEPYTGKLEWTPDKIPSNLCIKPESAAFSGLKLKYIAPDGAVFSDEANVKIPGMGLTLTPNLIAAGGMAKALLTANITTPTKWELIGGTDIGATLTVDSKFEATITASSQGGRVTVKVTNTDSKESVSKTLTVVAADEIVYRSGTTYVTMPSAAPLLVASGTKLNLKAIPDPSDASWPLNTPTWTNVTPKQDAPDMSLASFNSDTTVKVACGTSSVSRNVKVARIVSLTAEAKTKDKNKDWGCMEKRTVTFTASASGFPSRVSSPMFFTLVYQDPSGNNQIIENRDWSWDQVEDFNITLAEVPDKGQPAQDHYYDSRIYAKAEHSEVIGVAKTETKTCRVYELWITKFADHSHRDKDWKVCVGDRIQFDAIGSDNCVYWSWSFWNSKWKLSGKKNTRKGTEAYIPYSCLKNAKNEWFGDAWGVVAVSCYNGDGDEIVSTSLSQGYRAKVFFDPDLGLDGKVVTTRNPAAWYIFWKEGKVVGGMEDTEWVKDAAYIDIFGYYPLTGKKKKRKVHLARSACDVNDRVREITHRNGFKVKINGGGKHLNCVRETIIHEKYHEYVDKVLNKDTKAADDIDSDGLPNQEEITPTKYRGLDKFPVTHPALAISYTDWPTDPDYFTYADQEVRCRILEIFSEQLYEVHPEKDWSRDTENPKW